MKRTSMGIFVGAIVSMVAAQGICDPADAAIALGACGILAIWGIGFAILARSE